MIEQCDRRLKLRESIYGGGHANLSMNEHCQMEQEVCVNRKGSPHVTGILVVTSANSTRKRTNLS